MKMRQLGRTKLMVSEIGFGAEWLTRHPQEESVELVRMAGKRGVNIIDCWMPDPGSRDIIGKGMAGNRENWIVQGHFGATWQNGQYVRTRDMKYVKPAFEDLLKRLQTDYIDLGMIHYVDFPEEWNSIQDSDYLRYVFEMKEKGVIRHIGLSTHNPEVAKMAVKSGYVEMLLFSINPAYDMLPATENTETLFQDPSEYKDKLCGIDSSRAELYSLCEQYDVGITVMKGFAGSRLFDAKRSPFGVALTPIQCIHYSLTRPAVASILCGFDTVEYLESSLAYETATEEEKDYATPLANAPRNPYSGQCTYCGHCKPCVANLDIAMINKYYDLATMQSETPESVKSHYLLLDHHADECIGCRACESRCPFSVPIADRMKKAAELFGK